MTYIYLSQPERYQTQALMKTGQTQIEIARILERHKSTICREVARGSGRRGYRPRQAPNLSEVSCCKFSATVFESFSILNHCI